LACVERGLQFALGRLRSRITRVASALEKIERGADLIHPSAPQPATASLFIVNPLRAGGWVTNLFSTHPSTAQRVQQLLALARKWQRVAA
jgi:Zn-dependent protease with chaperone function